MPSIPKTNKVIKIKAPENRLPSNQRGYDSSWRTVRMQHLLNYPLCAECLDKKRFTVATDVHHLKKLAENPHLRDVSSNLQSLCHSCHSIKTARGE